ncbi:MAG TPA: PAS domain S-box protein [Prolixibacteraceae bacterium]
MDKTLHSKISSRLISVVLLIGLFALIGWFGNISFLASFNKSYIPMAPGTAISLILLSAISLTFLLKNKNTKLIQVILSIVFLFHFGTLIDNLLEYPIAIERVFGTPTPVLGTFTLGRMSPLTLVLFLIISVSLFIITNSAYRFYKLAFFLCSIGMYVAFILDLGYLYGTPLLYGKSIIPPALNTSIAFTILFLGIFFGFGMNEMPLKLFIGQTIRARLLRSFLPVTVLIIVLAGWADTLIYNHFNDHIFVSSFITIISIFAVGLSIVKESKGIGNDLDNAFAFRKEAEAAIRESELHFRTLADSGQALIWTSGLDKKCNYFNQPWLYFTGRSLVQELNDGWVEGVHPEDVIDCFETHSTAFDKRERFSMDYRLRFRDGQYRWIQDNGTPRFNSQGEFIGYIGHCLDITERKSAEEALKLSEERFRTLLDNVVNVSVQGYNSDGVIKYWNKASETLYQYSEQEAMGKNLLDLIIPPSLKTEVQESIKTMLHQGKGNPPKELVLMRKDGSSVAVYSNHSVINIPGKEKELFCIDVDLSEQKQFEQKLSRERMMLRTLIDNLPVTIYVKDVECRKIIANKADLDLIGAKSEHVIGKTDLDIFNNEIGQRGFADDKIVIETGVAVLNREEDFFDTNGVQRWLLTSKIPLTDENGKVLGLVGIGRDITTQKQDQEKILKLSKGIEQNPSSIEITDINGIIEYVNPKLCKTTGYTAEEIIGQHTRFLKSNEMSEETYSDLWRTIGSGNVWKKELLNRKKDGSLFWELVTLTSIKNDKDVITNYIAIKEDISSRKEMEAELIRAKEKAEESDQLKSAFLANMSHEIRTPLNSIIGFSELLTDPDFEPDQKDEFIRTIIDNGNSLLVIISDIMDFSMLEARQIKIRKEVISTKMLLNELLNDFVKKADQKGIELRLDQSLSSQDVMFENDSFRIKQIFSNLLGNALKFTHTGYIQIGYNLTNEFIEFNVKDTGIGIAPEYHQAIFERFRQVDTTKTRKYGGNGLGLAISKNLVELLGGNIWVESEPGNFSNFFFSIPIGKL